MKVLHLSLLTGLTFDIRDSLDEWQNKIVILKLDHLQVWRTTLQRLVSQSLLANDSTVDLFSGASQVRIKACCQLLIRLKGSGFLNRKHMITVNIFEENVCGSVDWESGKDKTSHLESGNLEIMGYELIKRLGVPKSHSNFDGPSYDCDKIDQRVSVIAYYLPVLDYLPEDKNFNEKRFEAWLESMSGTPPFPGHGMTQLPQNFAFRETFIEGVRRRQADLAIQHGIDAFCYHFYWYAGRRVMQESLDEILLSGVPKLNFCLCWANDTLSCEQDGVNQVLVEQKHDSVVDAKLVTDLLPYFADQRYLKVDGSPMLLVYRLGILDKPREVIAAWKAAVIEAGFPGLFVIAARTFGLTDEQAGLVDAVVEFPPHGCVSGDVQNEIKVRPGFKGRVYDYREVVVNAASSPPTPYTCFPGIMPQYDNTAQRGSKSHSFLHATPAAFQLWANLALARAANMPNGRRFLFINSGSNAEQRALLEPEYQDGLVRLNAFLEARKAYPMPGLEDDSHKLSSNDSISRTVTQGVVDVRPMIGMALIKITQLKLQRTKRLASAVSCIKSIRRIGVGLIDHSTPLINRGRIIVTRDDEIHVRGWTIKSPNVPHLVNRLEFLTFTDLITKQVHYFCEIRNWNLRKDVKLVNRLRLPDFACYFGFDIRFNVADLPLGYYDLHVVEILSEETAGVTLGTRVVRA